jgi:alkylhydroperoxidase/carboxymuconolactone decarboxylase family protein YurZ
MHQEARFQETLRKLAMIHEGFVQDKARLGLDLARTATLDPKTAALLVLAVTVAIGSSSASRCQGSAPGLSSGLIHTEVR